MWLGWGQEVWGKSSLDLHWAAGDTSGRRKARGGTREWKRPYWVLRVKGVDQALSKQKGKEEKDWGSTLWVLASQSEGALGCSLTTFSPFLHPF